MTTFECNIPEQAKPMTEL